MAVRTVRESDGFYDASQHLDEVEGRTISWNMDKDNHRHLSSLDLFAGKGNFCDECEKQNYQSMTVDVKEDPVHFESHRFQLYFGCDTDYCAFAT